MSLYTPYIQDTREEFKFIFSIKKIRPSLTTSKDGLKRLKIHNKTTRSWSGIELSDAFLSLIMAAIAHDSDGEVELNIVCIGAARVE